MRKRRKRKRGYGSWWLAVGRVAKEGFYMQKYFMDCVGVWCLQVACVWGWCFQSLWIAKGGEMGFVVGGLGGVNGLAGNSLVLEAVGD